MIKFLLVCALLTVTPLPLVGAAETTTPQAVVEHLHATLLEAMRESQTLGYAGRAALIRPVVETSFDFDTIARIVNGQGWKQASEEQKAAFIEVFRNLSVATYATNFSGYDGEQFETTGSEDGRGSVIVRTDLVKSDGERIPLHYMVREVNGQWLIVNVIAQGVSDLSLKRAEYTAVINAEGFDSLVQRLRDKVTEMSRSK